MRKMYHLLAGIDSPTNDCINSYNELCFTMFMWKFNLKFETNEVGVYRVMLRVLVSYATRSSEFLETKISTTFY